MQYLINEASATGLFRLILVIFAAYLVYAFITRILLPYLLRNTLKSFHQNFVNRDHGHAEQDSRKMEGEITIEYLRKPDRKQRPVDEEYVDYEEIK